MISLQEQIQNFVPYNEQEAKDKEFFLKWLKDFRNLLTRDNEYAHFSSSAFVVNKERTKMLVVKHNIYELWIYPGGHADGEEDLLSVSVREVEQETGLVATPIFSQIFSIQALPTKGHIKRGKYISSHTHLDVIYLLEADDKLALRGKEDENSGVKWIPLENSYDENIVDWARPVNEKNVRKLQKLSSMEY